MSIIRWLLGVFIAALAQLSLSKNLGYCPTGTTKECRQSLKTALDVVTNCPLERERTKKCAFILVETLAEADHKAPFFEEFYEKDFEIGDVDAYKKEIDILHQYSANAWHVLHNLSKALVLAYVSIDALSEEQKRELETLIDPVFEKEEGQSFHLHDQAQREHFMAHTLDQARAIAWP